MILCDWEGQMTDLFWLSDSQWERIKPHLPVYKRGFRRVDDRRVISGIIHVLQTGIPWRAAPKEYGPGRTLYNRFRRWAEKGIWEKMFASLADEGFPERVAIDSTIVRAHRSASGGKGGHSSNASGARAAAPRPRSTS